MLILGIETSCDETAAAVVRDGREVLSNTIASQNELHEEYGGVVPEIASRAHVERILPIVRRALTEAGIGLRDIGAVAVGHRPGLIGSLLVGVSAAKGLAWSLGVPLIGVDHVQAHLYAGLLVARGGTAAGQAGRSTDDVFPALGLVVSGGHTVLYRMRSPIEMERLGSTIDDAVGEAYDKAAVILGLGHAGGPKVDALASGGDERAVALPISRVAPESLDFSFSGLKTALLYKVRGFPGQEALPPPLTDSRRADLAASFQFAAVGALSMKVERALAHLEAGGEPARALIIGGGVSANSRLRREAATLAAKRGIGLLIPAMAFCTDNAAMIAGLAHARMRAGLVDDLSLRAMPTTGG
jgi:N6-L-threonylcarbamoyladenine synthase